MTLSTDQYVLFALPYQLEPCNLCYSYYSEKFRTKSIQTFVNTVIYIPDKRDLSNTFIYFGNRNTSYSNKSLILGI